MKRIYFNSEIVDIMVYSIITLILIGSINVYIILPLTGSMFSILLNLFTCLGIIEYFNYKIQLLKFLQNQYNNNFTIYQGFDSDGSYIIYEKRIWK